MKARLLVVISTCAVVACTSFDSADRPGQPCDPPLQGCPGNQVCVEGVCELPGDGGIVADGGIADAASDAFMPDLVSYGNTTMACRELGVFPLAGEEMHYVAGAITPTERPFHVKKIQYELRGDDVVATNGDTINCDATLAHSVILFTAGEAQAPPSVPVVLRQAAIAADPAAGDVRTVEVEFPVAAAVLAGERVFVGIQNAGTYPAVTCPFTCIDQPGVNSFWSNAAVAPYTWQLLSDFNINGELDVHVIGYSP